MQTACAGSFLVKSRCGLGEDNRSWDQDKGPLPVRKLDSRLHLEPYYPTNFGSRADAPMMGRLPNCICRDRVHLLTSLQLFLERCGNESTFRSAPGALCRCV